ncbi:NUDIX domain-containing protein [Candidatus Woesearchaeota archaeon]|nr:NUDIX domain-containing protein [Candidatus Woesearchaeota archaeon]
MMRDLIVVVNEKDEETGTEEKNKCHDGKGILHRAFLLMAYNERGELLLARRSPDKRLWPGYWDGTVASHIHPNETYEEAAAKRLKEELGIAATSIQYLLKFKYAIPYKDKGSENEICAVLKCTYTGTIKPNPAEVSQHRLIKPSEIRSQSDFAPWLLIAISELREQAKL